ncbi:MAG TPA: hypothetical protein VE078_16025 [Thermoanaerobaculia bacterium]|nr:hypothetical protein [Thermoanaerobaculia bacterium]
MAGAKLALIAFFFYSGIESTMGLWGGSFLFKTKGLDPAAAATWVSLFYASITLGRFLTGFVGSTFLPPIFGFVASATTLACCRCSCWAASSC